MKIAVTGPESTGKSWLCKQIAKNIDCVLIPEYAREYLSGRDTDYTCDDVVAIAKEQNRLIKSAYKNPDMDIVADTELLVTSIWFIHKYKQPNDWIEQHLRQQAFDIYLVCNIDLPWEDDPLREHPELRRYFFNLYKQRLSYLDVNYEIVSGVGEERLNSALYYIKKHFKITY